MNELWGVSGIILAIPIAAGIKIMFDRIAPLKAVGALMGSNIVNEQGLFLSDYNENRFRFSSLFIKENKEKEIESKSNNSDTPKQ
jgi:hypothetical protein